MKQLCKYYAQKLTLITHCLPTDGASTFPAPIGDWKYGGRRVKRMTDNLHPAHTGCAPYLSYAYTICFIWKHNCFFDHLHLLHLHLLKLSFNIIFLTVMSLFKCAFLHKGCDYRPTTYTQWEDILIITSEVLLAQTLYIFDRIKWR